jgi:hypothetical protein
MKQTKKTKWHFAGLKAEETKRRLAEKRGYRWAKPWRDTHMPATGAEHYVVAQLMFRDIDAFKCERGRAGTDVVAADTKYGTSVSIQVKSLLRVLARGSQSTGSDRIHPSPRIILSRC